MGMGREDWLTTTKDTDCCVSCEGDCCVVACMDAWDVIG